MCSLRRRWLDNIDCDVWDLGFEGDRKDGATFRAEWDKMVFIKSKHFYIGKVKMKSFI